MTEADLVLSFCYLCYICYYTGWFNLYWYRCWSSDRLGCLDCIAHMQASVITV